MKQWTAQEIEDFRRTYKLTRKVLGELLGVTVSSIYQWEKEVKKPSKTAMILLSRIEDEFSLTKKRIENEKGGGKIGKVKRHL